MYLYTAFVDLKADFDSVAHSRQECKEHILIALFLTTVFAEFSVKIRAFTSVILFESYPGSKFGCV